MSQSSVVSISSNDESNINSISDAREASMALSSYREMMPAPLEPLNTIEDVEMLLDNEMSQSQVIRRLGIRWTALTSNFDSVLKHLNDCSLEVTEASTNCLQSLDDNISSTCDKVDAQVKALYTLIARCDELILGLRITQDFREEIKNLRKSVETLAILHKSKPQNR